jgi:uncharacterized protein
MAKTNGATRLVPLREGLFRMPRHIGGKPRLYGQRCLQCGQVFATQRVHCAACSSPDLERITLSQRGEVTTYTIVRQQLAGSLIRAPYVIARVRLPEGVTIQTILADVDPERDRIDIGMPVEICLREVSRDDSGNPIVNFFFRPTGRRRTVVRARR